MRVETRKKLIFRRKLILTKAEQKIFQDLYRILDEDDLVDTNEVWDILTDISVGSHSMTRDYGYDIEIID